MLSIPEVTNCQNAKGGNLYVVATPIGNLQDITLRALAILNSVDVVAAEDTRHTGHLLSHFGIHAPLVSCHEFNENVRADALIGRIAAGESVALVSDAGTPSVSDPGYRLICRAIEKGVGVVPVPGVSAAITALCVSGLPTDAFVFIGFAPRKKKQMDELIEGLKSERRTLVFYESPRRVLALVEALKQGLGDRPAVLARELTKIHEEFLRHNLSDLGRILSERAQIKGECTLLVGGFAGEQAESVDLDLEIARKLESSNSGTSALARELAEKHGLNRRDVYEAILRIQKKGGK